MPVGTRAPTYDTRFARPSSLPPFIPHGFQGRRQSGRRGCYSTCAALQQHWTIPIQNKTPPAGNSWVGAACIEEQYEPSSLAFQAAGESAVATMTSPQPVNGLAWLSAKRL